MTDNPLLARMSDDYVLHGVHDGRVRGVGMDPGAVHVALNCTDCGEERNYRLDDMVNVAGLVIALDQQAQMAFGHRFDHARDFARVQIDIARMEFFLR